MRSPVFALTLAVIVLVSSPAMAILTLAANWNGGDPPTDAPVTWEESDFDYMNRQSPPYPVENDYALLGIPDWWTAPTITPSGKFGSGLDCTQDPADPNKATGGYLIANYLIEGNLMFDDAGTITLWFKPNWDPATDTEIRHIVSTQQYYPAQYNDHRVDVIVDVAGANSRLEFTNMDGSVTTSVPYDPSRILNDWNHIAIAWDVDGTRLYMNGELAATSPEKMAVSPSDVEDQYLFIGGRQAPPTSVDMYGADGIFDDFGIYSTALYTGAGTYDLPGEIDTVRECDDGDGFVGQSDLDIVLGSWGQTVPPGHPCADHDGDGFVGQTDLDTVLSDWGQGTPPAAPEPATLSVLGLGALALMRRRRT